MLLMLYNALTKSSNCSETKASHPVNLSFLDGEANNYMPCWTCMFGNRNL